MSLAGEIPSSFTDSSPLALKVLITADPKEVYLRRAERWPSLPRILRWKIIWRCVAPWCWCSISYATP